MTHPHLLFSSEEAPSLHQRLQQGPRSRIHLEHAIRCCEHFIDPSAPKFFDFRKRQSDYWHNRQGNFIIPARLLTLTLTGWLADRPEFLKTAAEAILTIIREGCVDKLGDYTAWRNNYGHDAGKYFKMIGLLYDLLYQELGEEGRKTLIDHADETFSIAEGNLSNAMKFIDNNRGSRFCVGLAVLGAAMREAGGKKAELAGKYALSGRRWLELSIRLILDEDGAPFEGASYGTSHACFLAVGAQILARCGLRDCRDDARLRRIGDYVVQETVYSEGWVNNLNDCSHGSFPQIVYYAGVQHNRPACLWLWDQFGCDPSFPLAPVHPSRCPDDFFEIPWYLLWPDDRAAEAAAPDRSDYPNARHFRGRGVVSIRGGWGPQDLHTTMMSGAHLITGHRQGDQNQVTLYALGELFLIDSGYSLTNPQTGERIPGLLPEAHNLILVDGAGQGHFMSGDGWPMGHVKCFVLGPDHACVLGDARESYHIHGALRRAERHLHAVWKAGIPPYVVWVDDIEADGKEHRYTLLLHTGDKNRFEWEGSRIVIHGRENRLDIHLVTSSSAAVHADTFGGHPRLHLDLTAVRGRFVLLLHPRRADTPEAKFDVALGEDSITAHVSMSGHSACHEFDTRPRPDIYSGEPENYIRPPSWQPH